jgi:hypothetical protein
MKVARRSALGTGRFYPLPPKEVPMVLVSVKKLSRLQGHSAVGGIKPKKNPNDTNKSQTRDLLFKFSYLILSKAVSFHAISKPMFIIILTFDAKEAI